MSSNEIKRKNLSLFDDDDEDDVLDDAEPEEFDLNLDEKLNKSDRKTSKLIELQSRFAHDSRFKIGEQFLDDDEEDEAPKTEIEEEKSKNLAILEQVLGKKIHHSKPIDPVNEYRKTSQDKRHSVVKSSSGPSVFNSVLAPRFDPTKEASKIYEIEDAATKKRKVNIDFDELDRRDELESKKKAKTDTAKTATSPTKKDKADAKKKETKVSFELPKKDATLAENYYEVNTNLKDALASTEDFSLGSFLGLDAFEAPANEVARANENATYEPISENERKKLKKLRNPFKYDSSDDEDESGRHKWNDQEADEEGGYDEEVADEEADDAVQIKLAPQPQMLAAFGGFFFRANDPRLKQDQFYTPELVKKIIENGKDRKMAMMRALGFRKRAATKNVKSSEKYAKKLKMMRMAQGKGKKGRRNFRNPRFHNNRNNWNNRQSNDRNKPRAKSDNKPTASASA